MSQPAPQKSEQEAKYEERIVPFTAGDGFQCNLIHLQGKHPPTKGPVMLVHGAGVRANLFARRSRRRMLIT